MPLLPHHRAYGSRTTAVRLIELFNVQQDPEALAAHPLFQILDRRFHLRKTVVAFPAPQVHR